MNIVSKAEEQPRKPTRKEGRKEGSSKPSKPASPTLSFRTKSTYTHKYTDTDTDPAPRDTLPDYESTCVLVHDILAHPIPSRFLPHPHIPIPSQSPHNSSISPSNAQHPTPSHPLPPHPTPHPHRADTPPSPKHSFPPLSKMVAMSKKKPKNTHHALALAFNSHSRFRFPFSLPFTSILSRARKSAREEGREYNRHEHITHIHAYDIAMDGWILPWTQRRTGRQTRRRCWLASKQAASQLHT